MARMQLFSKHMRAYVVETSIGDEIVPAELVGDLDREFSVPASTFAPYIQGEIGETGKVPAYTPVAGYFARYSAPGFLDCIEWVGPYATAREAEDACESTYGGDDSGE